MGGEGKISPSCKGLKSKMREIDKVASDLEYLSTLYYNKDLDICSADTLKYMRDKVAYERGDSHPSVYAHDSMSRFCPRSSICGIKYHLPRVVETNGSLEVWWRSKAKDGANAFNVFRHYEKSVGVMIHYTRGEGGYGCLTLAETLDGRTISYDTISKFAPIKLGGVDGDQDFTVHGDLVQVDDSKAHPCVFLAKERCRKGHETDGIRLLCHSIDFDSVSPDSNIGGNMHTYEGYMALSKTTLNMVEYVSLGGDSDEYADVYRVNGLIKENSWDGAVVCAESEYGCDRGSSSVLYRPPEKTEILKVMCVRNHMTFFGQVIPRLNLGDGEYVDIPTFSDFTRPCEVEVHRRNGEYRWLGFDDNFEFDGTRYDEWKCPSCRSPLQSRPLIANVDYCDNPDCSEVNHFRLTRYFEVLDIYLPALFTISDLQSAGVNGIKDLLFPDMEKMSKVLGEDASFELTDTVFSNPPKSTRDFALSLGLPELQSEAESIEYIEYMDIESAGEWMEYSLKEDDFYSGLAQDAEAILKVFDISD